jgi:transcriptional antiterminator NusG
MNEFQWYIIRAVSGQEKKIKSMIEKELNKSSLNDYITQILIPTEKVVQNRKSKDGKVKKVAVEKNLYPGYIILQANFDNGEVVHLVRNIPGVIGFLNLDEEKKESKSAKTRPPKSVREVEIRRIMGKMEEETQVDPLSEVVYKVGEKVKVVDGGAFHGFIGIVNETFEEKKKLNIMVKIFERYAPMEVNYNQVEKAE